MDSKRHYTNSPEVVYMCLLNAPLRAAFGSEFPAPLTAGDRERVGAQLLCRGSVFCTFWPNYPDCQSRQGQGGPSVRSLR